MRERERVHERRAPLAKLGEVENVEPVFVDQQVVENEIAVLADASNRTKRSEVGSGAVDQRTTALTERRELLLEATGHVVHLDVEAARWCKPRRFGRHRCVELAE